ncbi:MAG: hypothetical protein ABL904_06040 [Hyphomicrobiaceae bacterium]
MPPKTSFWDYLPQSNSQFQRAKAFAFAIVIFTWLSIMVLASIKYAIIDLPNIRRVVNDGVTARAEYTCHFGSKGSISYTANWQDAQNGQRTATLRYNARHAPYISLCHVQTGEIFYLANEPSVPPVPKLVANAEIQGGLEEILGKLFLFALAITVVIICDLVFFKQRKW